MLTPVIKCSFASVNIQAYIDSGIIEVYCLGFTTPEEASEVEEMAALYPQVAAEIERIRTTFNDFIGRQEITPSVKVKQGVMRTIYKQQSQTKHEYVPLLDELKDSHLLFDTVKANQLAATSSTDEDLTILELPSTKEVINLAVWAKTGVGEENHEAFDEYVAIMKGSCNMYLNEEKISFSEGAIIHIPRQVTHRAVVTSEEPMFAIVQRQSFY